MNERRERYSPNQAAPTLNLANPLSLLAVGQIDPDLQDIFLYLGAALWMLIVSTHRDYPLFVTHNLSIMTV